MTGGRRSFVLPVDILCDDEEVACARAASLHPVFTFGCLFIGHRTLRGLRSERARDGGDITGIVITGARLGRDGHLAKGRRLSVPSLLFTSIFDRIVFFVSSTSLFVILPHTTLISRRPNESAPPAERSDADARQSISECCPTIGSTCTTVPCATPAKECKVSLDM